MSTWNLRILPYLEKGLRGYRYLIRGPASLGWSLNPMSGVLISTGEDTEWYRRMKAHVMTQGETGAMKL